MASLARLAFNRKVAGMDPETRYFPDAALIAMLREAAEQAQESVDRSRVMVRETYWLLRLAQRMEGPLIESRERPL
jgi:hypothetical protein